MVRFTRAYCLLSQHASDPTGIPDRFVRIGHRTSPDDVPQVIEAHLSAFGYVDSSTTSGDLEVWQRHCEELPQGRHNCYGSPFGAGDGVMSLPSGHTRTAPAPKLPVWGQPCQPTIRCFRTC